MTTPGKSHPPPTPHTQISALVLPMTTLRTASMLVNPSTCPRLQTNTHCSINQVTETLKGEEICWQKVGADLTDFIALFSPELETVSVGFLSSPLICLHLKFQDINGEGKYGCFRVSQGQRGLVFTVTRQQVTRSSGQGQAPEECGQFLPQDGRPLSTCDAGGCCSGRSWIYSAFTLRVFYFCTVPHGCVGWPGWQAGGRGREPHHWAISGPSSPAPGTLPSSFINQLSPPFFLLFNHLCGLLIKFCSFNFLMIDSRT